MSKKNLNPNALPAVAEHSSSDGEHSNPDSSAPIAAPIEIILTDELKAAMKHYGVKRKKENITVTHLTYGIQTVCTPSVYAVYETAVCAQYVNFVLYGGAGAILPSMAHFYQLVERLPYIPTTWFKSEDKYLEQSSKDYQLAAKTIADAGLHYALLD